MFISKRHFWTWLTGLTKIYQSDWLLKVSFYSEVLWLWHHVRFFLIFVQFLSPKKPSKNRASLKKNLEVRHFVIFGSKKNLCQRPLKTFPTDPISRDWAEGEMILKILVNGFYIVDLRQKYSTNFRKTRCIVWKKSSQKNLNFSAYFSLLSLQKYNNCRWFVWN